MTVCSFRNCHEEHFICAFRSGEQIISQMKNTLCVKHDPISFCFYLHSCDDSILLLEQGNGGIKQHPFPHSTGDENKQGNKITTKLIIILQRTLCFHYTLPLSSNQHHTNYCGYYLLPIKMNLPYYPASDTRSRLKM